MLVEQAAYDTVHGAKNGGAKAIAAKMEVSHQVLLNKVNPNNDTHHLQLSEAVKLMRVTGDTRIIEALANEFGGTFTLLPTLSSAVPPNLISDLAKISENFGGLMQEVARDLADGVITDNELKRVQKEAAALREGLAVLLRDLHRLNESRREGGSASVAPLQAAKAA